LCDGTRSVAEIVQALKQRYGAEGIEGDVMAFLDGLAAKGLVTYAPPAPPPYPPTPSAPPR